MGSIDLARDGHVAVVTLNRPDKRNAMTDAMWRQVPAVMAEVDADDDLLVTVVHGAGGSFCAGSDIADLDALHHAEGPINAEEALARSPKPVIAAVEGHCHGGGCELSLGADLRIAGAGAQFSIPPAKLGIVFPVSATQRMIHLMGPAVTKELLFTARRITAERALALGLVNEVVADRSAFDRALEVARGITELSQLTVRASKEIVDGLVRRDLSAETAIAWVRRANASPDLLEGRDAFAERRPPVFTWRPPRR
ncbi:enoyl-CoA hydratase/isomerase family protein [Propioniciclava sp.]|uniref:enoyl-CoA hydratase/isomerase family protein n=1 Tax=Propioniciclava sp. TaxID=2038686 RepID=UPI002614F989|nr:enoyl-CoA hydratase/isomerase family protein [Propioniciclava sp.]